MNSQSLFEIFNHFVSSRDPAQLLSMADDVEIFGSSTFGDGKTYIGNKAPAKFRETISVAKVSKPDIKLNVKHAVTNGDHGLFFLVIEKGRKKTTSALDLVVSNGKLKCFHEVRTKV